MLAYAQSDPVYYWRSVLAAANAYWLFALLTIAVDAHAFPWTRVGWLRINPVAGLGPALGDRVTRLLTVMALVLGLNMLGVPESIAFTALFIAIHFLPAGFLRHSAGELIDRREEKT